MDQELNPNGGDATQSAVTEAVLNQQTGDSGTQEGNQTTPPNAAPVDSAQPPAQYASKDSVDGLYSQLGDLKAVVTDAVELIRAKESSQETPPTEVAGVADVTPPTPQSEGLEKSKEDSALRADVIGAYVHQMPELTELRVADSAQASFIGQMIVDSAVKNGFSGMELHKVFETSPVIKTTLDQALLVARANATVAQQNPQGQQPVATAPVAGVQTPPVQQPAPQAPVVPPLSNRPGTSPVEPHQKEDMLGDDLSAFGL
jgi:hypothetical protein